MLPSYTSCSYSGFTEWSASRLWEDICWYCYTCANNCVVTLHCWPYLWLNIDYPLQLCSYFTTIVSSGPREDSPRDRLAEIWSPPHHWRGGLRLWGTQSEVWIPGWTCLLQWMMDSTNGCTNLKTLRPMTSATQAIFIIFHADVVGFVVHVLMTFELHMCGTILHCSMTSRTAIIKWTCSESVPAHLPKGSLPVSHIWSFFFLSDVIIYIHSPTWCFLRESQCF